MKLYKAFLSGLAMVACLTASAQEAKPGDQVVNEFVPHFYVQGNVGAQYTLGEISFGKLIAPNAQLGVGYDFNKWFGLRFSVNAWQSKGGWDFDHTPYSYNGDANNPQIVAGNPTSNTYKWKWNYVQPQLDAMFNLSNLVAGYNPNRFFNVIGFVGAGLNIAWHNDDAQNVAAAVGTVTNNNQNLEYLWDGTKVRGTGRAGLDFDFRVSQKVSIMLEGAANLTTDHYNSKKASHGDWFFNGLVGVKINLGKTNNTRVIPAPEPQVVERVVEKIVEKPVPAKVENEELRRDIFFTINKSNIAASERSKVEEIVDYLKNHPDARVSVTGYADAGTGNAKINERIAKARANSVANELQTKYGIAASRITVDSKGDTVQPFAENDRNRVVIAIAK